LPEARAASILPFMHDLIEVVKANAGIIGIAGGPLTASLLARMLFGRSKGMMYLVSGASAWLAIRVILGPFMQMAKDNIGYLAQLTGH